MVSKQFLEEFIHMLKEEPAIWLLEHDDYKDIREKRKSWQRLLEKWKEVDKYATIDLVKSKYRTLRASFRREYRKQRKSEEAGEDYIPMLWYFDHLKFLVDQEVQPESTTSFAFDEEEESPDEEEQSEVVSPSDFSFDEEKEPSPKKMKLTERKHNERKREERTPEERKREERTPDEGKLEEKKAEPLFYEADIDYPQNTHKRVNRDEADIYSEAWAVTFRKLSEEQKIWAKRLIDDALMYGRLCQLSAVSSINLGEYE